MQIQLKQGIGVEFEGLRKTFCILDEYNLTIINEKHLIMLKACDLYDLADCTGKFFSVLHLHSLSYANASRKNIIVSTLLEASFTYSELQSQLLELLTFGKKQIEEAIDYCLSPCFCYHEDGSVEEFMHDTSHEPWSLEIVSSLKASGVF